MKYCQMEIRDFDLLLLVVSTLSFCIFLQFSQPKKIFWIIKMVKGVALAFEADEFRSFNLHKLKHLILVTW